MNGDAEKLSSPVAALRLSGTRFKPHGIPASALPEIVAYEELVRELAKLIFRNRTSRKRVPAGYDKLLSLNLTEVQDGSATSTLERSIADRQGDLFADLDYLEPIGDGQIASDLEQACGYIEKLFEAAVSGGSIPQVFYQIPQTLVKKIGQTLQPGDGMQVAPSKEAAWATKPSYSTVARENLLRKFNAIYSRPVNIRGYIENISPTAKVCLLRTDQNLVAVPFGNTRFHFEIDGQQESRFPEYYASGLGEFNMDNDLIRLSEVDDFGLVSDPRVLDSVRRSLLEFAQLEDGWIDGEHGEALDHKILDVASELVRTLFDHALLTQYVYPTPEGGVQLEWSPRGREVSLNLDPRLMLARIRTSESRTGKFFVRELKFSAREIAITLEEELRQGIDG